MNRDPEAQNVTTHEVHSDDKEVQKSVKKTDLAITGICTNFQCR
jgi:hypothetical protein